MAEDTFTPYMKLRKIAGNRFNWSQRMNDNMTLIDAIISAFFLVNDLIGPWENAFEYVEGNRVIDVDDAKIYTCLVDHTSASIPTTFAEDRADNPSYWTQFTSLDPDSESSTSYLSANVAMGVINTFFNGPSVGPVGAAGQVWLIMAKAVVSDTAGNANMVIQISDGVNIIDTGNLRSTSGFGGQGTLHVVVELDGAKTFTLQVKNTSSIQGTILKDQASAGVTGKASSITAVRIA